MARLSVRPNMLLVASKTREKGYLPIWFRASSTHSSLPKLKERGPDWASAKSFVLPGSAAEGCTFKASSAQALPSL